MPEQAQHNKANPTTPPAGQSIIEALNQVMRQVQYDYFAEWRSKQTDPFYKELCLIIAEVLVLDPDAIIKVNGMNLRAHLVQEVYSQLKNEHIQLAFDNFHNVMYRVYNKKAYLRTALYNAVFELKSSYINILYT